MFLFKSNLIYILNISLSLSNKQRPIHNNAVNTNNVILSGICRYLFKEIKSYVSEKNQEQSPRAT